jgi:hypothetical protein
VAPQGGDGIDDTSDERGDTHQYRAVDHIGHVSQLHIDPTAYVPPLFFVGQV